jgi:hypothetical protein
VFETPKARTTSLFVTLAVKDVLDIQAGASLGESFVNFDGKRSGETRLLAKKGYEKASLGQRVWYTVGGIFEQ